MGQPNRNHRAGLRLCRPGTCTRSEPPAKRLKYFIKFLEFPDQLVANDAYGKLADAPYKDIAAVGTAVSSGQNPQLAGSPGNARRPAWVLYGMLIGLCGNNDDAAMLSHKISSPTAKSSASAWTV